MKKSLNKKKDVLKTNVVAKAVEEIDYFDYDFDLRENVLDLYELSRKRGYTKYVRSIERLIRNSVEMKTYRKFLTDVLRLDSCAFMSNISLKDEEIKKVRIEAHHYPFTLFDITSAVILSQLSKSSNGRLDEMDICNEVVKLHYQLKIGIVPLSKSMHDLHHSGELFINLNMVEGDYMYFLNRYKKFLSQESLIAYERIAMLSTQEKEDNNLIPENLELTIRKFDQERDRNLNRILDDSLKRIKEEEKKENVNDG